MAQWSSVGTLYLEVPCLSLTGSTWLFMEGYCVSRSEGSRNRDLEVSGWRVTRSAGLLKGNILCQVASEP